MSGTGREDRRWRCRLVGGDVGGLVGGSVGPPVVATKADWSAAMSGDWWWRPVGGRSVAATRGDWSVGPPVGGRRWRTGRRRCRGTGRGLVGGDVGDWSAATSGGLVEDWSTNVAGATRWWYSDVGGGPIGGPVGGDVGDWSAATSDWVEIGRSVVRRCWRTGRRRCQYSVEDWPGGDVGGLADVVGTADWSVSTRGWRRRIG
jgi:hypothetical protein